MKTFFKILFVVLVLANCGAFVILYPQHDSGAVEVESAAERENKGSGRQSVARIVLISEIERPIPAVIVESTSEPTPVDSTEIADEVDVVETIFVDEASVSEGPVD